jgi:hypothetical protein
VCPRPDRVRLRRAGGRGEAMHACMCRGGSSGKAHGRRTAGSRRPRSGSRRALKRLQPQESIEPGARLTPRGGRRTPQRCYTLKPGGPLQWEWRRSEALRVTIPVRSTYPRRVEAAGAWFANDMRVAGAERRNGCCGGKSSGGDNPMSATGMKQGRAVVGGASRQEGGKPWRRSVPR